MAECMLIMHGGQPEDFQMVVAKVLDLIESHFGKQESLLQNCKCLVLASPIQYLESEFSYEPKDVTFVQLFNFKFEKKEGELTYDHLWGVNGGYALCRIISRSSTPSLERSLLIFGLSLCWTTI